MRYYADGVDMHAAAACFLPVPLWTCQDRFWGLLKGTAVPVRACCQVAAAVVCLAGSCAVPMAVAAEFQLLCELQRQQHCSKGEGEAARV